MALGIVRDGCVCWDGNDGVEGRKKKGKRKKEKRKNIPDLSPPTLALLAIRTICAARTVDVEFARRSVSGACERRRPRMRGVMVPATCGVVRRSFRSLGVCGVEYGGGGVDGGWTGRRWRWR